MNLKFLLNGLRALIGNECIYSEGVDLGVVKICGVGVEDDLVIFDLQSVSSLIDGERLPDIFSISCSFEMLSIERSYLYAPYISWQLVTDKMLVDRIKSQIMLLDGNRLRRQFIYDI